jgi:hypothetical protein
MTDETLLDPPKSATGGGRSMRRGGGFRGTQDSGGGSGSTSDDDANRLAEMLKRIAQTLRTLIHLQPPLLPDEIRSEFIAVWPEAQRYFNAAVGTLSGQLPMRPYAKRKLVLAGLTGRMLLAKQRSLYFHLDRIDAAIKVYSGHTDVERPALTYPENPSLVRRLLFLVKPGFKLMNSVLGSIPAVVFPGKEIVKEVKEHVEAGYDSIEAVREELQS